MPRISISIITEDEKEAQLIISRLFRKNKTWDEALEEKGILPKEEPGEKKDEPAERLNVSPGEPSIGKIGGSTKEELLRIVGQGNKPPERFTEHLKLLWKRGEVKYDGEAYYL